MIDMAERGLLRRTVEAIFFAILLLGVLSILVSLRKPNTGHWSHAYHNKMTTIAAWPFTDDGLSQFPLLHWNERFADPDRVLHLLMRLVENVIPVNSAVFAMAGAVIVFLLLYLLCLRFLRPFAAFVFSLSVLLLGPVADRVLLSGPESLAMVCMLIYVGLLLYRRFLLAALFGGMHVLCSSIPWLAPVAGAVYLTAFFVVQGRAALTARSVFVAVFLPVIAMVCLLVSGADIYGAGRIDFASQPAGVYLQSLLLAAFFLGFAGYAIFKYIKFRRMRLVDLAFLLVFTLILCGLGVLIPVALEYLVLIAALLGGAALGWSMTSRSRKLVFVLLLLIFSIGSYWQNLGAKTEPSRTQRLWQALQGKEPPALDSVFHCDAALGTVLFLRAPITKLIDMLDDRILQKTDPARHVARISLMGGDQVDRVALLQKEFQTESIICDDPDFYRVLEQDIAFAQRGDVPAPLYRFEIDKNMIKNFVTEFKLAPVDMRRLFWKNKGIDEPVNVASEDRIFRLKPLWQDKSQQSCFAFRFANRDVQLHWNSYLAIGGGPHIYIWHGESAFYRGSFRSPALTQDIVPVPEKLKDRDDLVFIVCSEPGVDFFSFSLAVIGTDERRQLCQNTNRRCFARRR